MTHPHAQLPLTSERLILRRPHPDDLRAFQAYRTDPAIARLQGWSIATDAESLDFLTRMHQLPHFLPGQWFQLGVALRDTDHLIGDVGVCAHDATHAEIGFSIHPAHHRQGYGTEAVRLTLAHIEAATAIPRVVAQADVRNTASWRLLEGVGMTRQGQRTAEYKGEICDEYLYALDFAGG